MPAPDPKPETPASDSLETSNRKWLNELKSREFVPSAQVILAWDGTALRCEGPGLNGQRQKLEVSFDQLPAEIQSVLIEQHDRNKVAYQEAKKAKVERVDPQIERERKAHEAGLERIRRHMEWIETLPKHRRELELKKLADAKEKREQAETDRARQVWLMTAKDHDIGLANRVIDDPKRRPARKVVIAGTGNVVYSPRSEKSETAKTKRAKNVNKALAIKITL